MIVHTETGSIYEIDTEGMTQRRIQGSLSEPLRLDEQPVSIIELGQIKVGKPLRMVLDVRKDGIHVTLRTTSAVTRIE